MEDYKLFNQIQNTLDPAVDDIVKHCDTLKELWGKISKPHLEEKVCFWTGSNDTTQNYMRLLLDLVLGDKYYFYYY